MDAEGLADIQRDEERALSHGDLAALAAREERYDIHTALPGIIQAFDATKQTVTVQPAIKRLWREAGFLALPQFVDCPVQFPRGGGFVLTFPVKKGDECLVHFAERAIDNWHARGGVQEPSEMRLHDLSDGFAALGYSSVPEAAKIVNVSTDACELRTVDGTTTFRLDKNFATLGTAAGAERTYKADTHHNALDKYLDAIVAGTGAALSSLGLVPAGAALTAAQTAFKVAVLAGFSTKGKVG